MPGAARFRDKLEDAPVLLHQIVGAHPRRRIAEPPERGLPRGHAGVVQQQDVDRLAVRPGVVVGRGALDDLETGHAAPASSSSAIKLGRAMCRVRVCTVHSIPSGGVSLKNKKKDTTSK